MRPCINAINYNYALKSTVIQEDVVSLCKNTARHDWSKVSANNKKQEKSSRLWSPISLLYLRSIEKFINFYFCALLIRKTFVSDLILFGTWGRCLEISFHHVSSRSSNKGDSETRHSLECLKSSASENNPQVSLRSLYYKV